MSTSNNMLHTIFNVVRHQGAKLRFGVINREFLIEPKPRLIRIKNLTGIKGDVDVNPNKAYYRNGSIYKDSISKWLFEHFPREAGDDIWLLKFRFKQSDGIHIYEYIGDSGYKKIPRKKQLRTPKGKLEPCPNNSELCSFIWATTVNEEDSN